MRAHSESERSVWYVFLMHGRVPNCHYPTHTFRTVSLGNSVNRGKGAASYCWLARPISLTNSLRVSAGVPLFLTCSESILLECRCGQKLLLLGRTADWRKE